MDQAIKELGDRIVELDATNVTLVDAFEDMLEYQPAAAAPGLEIDALKAVDPAFDDQQCLAVARESFRQLAEAWEHRDAGIADGLLSAELMEQLREKIRADSRAERRHLLPGVEVHTAVITSGSVDAGIMTAVVRMHIIGREHFADADGNLVAGDDTYRQWDEDWTFRRDPSTDASSWSAVAITRIGAAELC